MNFTTAKRVADLVKKIDEINTFITKAKAAIETKRLDRRFSARFEGVAFRLNEYGIYHGEHYSAVPSHVETRVAWAVLAELEGARNDLMVELEVYK